MFGSLLQNLRGEKLQAAIVHHERVEFGGLEDAEKSLFGPIGIERNVGGAGP